VVPKADFKDYSSHFKLDSNGVPPPPNLPPLPPLPDFDPSTYVLDPIKPVVLRDPVSRRSEVENRKSVGQARSDKNDILSKIKEAIKQVQNDSDDEESSSSSDSDWSEDS